MTLGESAQQLSSFYAGRIVLCVVKLSVLKLIGFCAECGVHIAMLNVIVLGVVAPL